MFILILMLTDPPGTPGEPVCDGTTENTISLSWEPPTKDGGKPIKGYIVEKREKGSKKWTKWGSLWCFLMLCAPLFACVLLCRVICISIYLGGQVFCSVNQLIFSLIIAAADINGRRNVPMPCLVFSFMHIVKHFSIAHSVSSNGIEVWGHWDRHIQTVMWSSKIFHQ